MYFVLGAGGVGLHSNHNFISTLTIEANFCFSHLLFLLLPAHAVPFILMYFFFTCISMCFNIAIHQYKTQYNVKCNVGRHIAIHSAKKLYFSKYCVATGNEP